MNRDKKILLSFSIFMCSVVAITIIKGTYAYPLTMENTGGGKIVPLGGDEVCSKCNGSYVYAPVGANNCTPVADSYCTSKPSPSPSKKPSTSPSPSEKPSIPTHRYNVCYYCERDNIYHFGYREELGYCSGSWTIASLDESRCNNWYVNPSPSEKPPISSPPSGKPFVSPSPSSTPNLYCYVCSTDDSEVYWGPYPVPSNINSSCNGTWNPTAKTQDECKASASPSPSSTPNSYCYVCSTDDNKFYWGYYPVPSSISSSCSGTWKGTARTQEQCHAEDIPSNPNTGDVMLYIAYLIGFSSLFYSGYSFYRYRKQNNK